MQYCVCILRLLFLHDLMFFNVGEGGLDLSHDNTNVHFNMRTGGGQILPSPPVFRK